MLRWISGKTRHGHVHNEDNRDPYVVAPVVEKMWEVYRRCCNGKQSKGPKTTWV